MTLSIRIPFTKTTVAQIEVVLSDHGVRLRGLYLLAVLFAVTISYSHYIIIVYVKYF